MIQFKQRKNLLTPLLFLVGHFIVLQPAIGQEMTAVKGTVFNRATGKAIVGANIKVKGQDRTVLTDANGNYQLKAGEKVTLIISYVGFQKQEIQLDGRMQTDIFLEPADQELEEVVVIGYGQVKKTDATGAVASLKPDQLNKGVQITPQDALVGKIAGVNIVPGSGAPGSEGTIRIRMGASLSASNDPLIVIDGVPISSGSPLRSINPNDIETFTVLKDASASEIFCSVG